MTCTDTSKGAGLAIAAFVAMASLAVIGCGAGSAGDDEGDGDSVSSCNAAACMAYCETSVWGDAGPDDWGRREAVCLENGDCACNDYDCHPDNCNDWCRTDQQADGGVCEIFACICN